MIKFTLERIFYICLALLVLFIGSTRGNDTQGSIESMQESIAPYVSECNNIEYGYINKAVAYINSVCYFDDGSTWGFREKVIIIILPLNTFKRYSGQYSKGESYLDFMKQ